MNWPSFNINCLYIDHCRIGLINKMRGGWCYTDKEMRMQIRCSSVRHGSTSGYQPLKLSGGRHAIGIARPELPSSLGLTRPTLLQA